MWQDNKLDRPTLESNVSISSNRSSHSKQTDGDDSTVTKNYTMSNGGSISVQPGTGNIVVNTGSGSTTINGSGNSYSYTGSIGFNSTVASSSVYQPTAPRRAHNFKVVFDGFDFAYQNGGLNRAALQLNVEGIGRIKRLIGGVAEFDLLMHDDEEGLVLHILMTQMDVTAKANTLFDMSYELMDAAGNITSTILLMDCSIQSVELDPRVTSASRPCSIEVKVKAAITEFQ